jgi:hypothetical protein
LGETILSRTLYEALRLMARRTNKIQRLERKLNRYNHIMELVRTIVPVAVLFIQILILYKLSD